jgi:NADPH-dependent ferric siderophore reductase
MSKTIKQATVISTNQLTPHLQRITIASEEFINFTDKLIGHYVKVLIPRNKLINETITAKNAYMRSYTIQNVHPLSGDITLDFVINMHQGPATIWAQETKVGDTIAIAGPGPTKLDDFNQEHYVLLGDLTSVNALKGYLKKLPTTARIDAFVHTPTEQDIISLDSDRHVNWIVTNSPELALLDAIKSLTFKDPLPTIFMALEAGLVSQLKDTFKNQYTIPRTQIVSSGYWKKGLNAEDYKVLRQQSNNE